MTPSDQRTDLKALVSAYERRLILDALEATGGHQRRTASRLGLLPTTLPEKMKRLGLLSRSSERDAALHFRAADFSSESGIQEGGLTLVTTF